MNINEFESYRKSTLISNYKFIQSQVNLWEKKVDRTKGGSDKQKEYFLKSEIETLEGLKVIMDSYGQLVNLLKCEIVDKDSLIQTLVNENSSLTKIVKLIRLQDLITYEQIK